MSENNTYDPKDSMDINELLSLNEDISPEFIDQLQQKISVEASTPEASTQKSFDVNDDTTLFEEPSTSQEANPTTSNQSQDSEADDATKADNKKKEVNVTAFDDNFLKKYKAKLNKQQTVSDTKPAEESRDKTKQEPSGTENIEQLSGGNISEHTITDDIKSYNESLDFLDDNTKYSKYVIYIDPKNTDFIESLTVKERKNLINKILKEQNDIMLTKHRFALLNHIMRHAIVAILTLTISIPIIYWTINASLEATINNYRQSQSMFETLYRENSKVKKN